MSANVRTETLDTIEEYAEDEKVNRSQAIDRIVDEWSARRAVDDSGHDGPTFWLMVSAVLAVAGVLSGVAALLVYLTVWTTASLMVEVGILAIMMSVTAYLLAEGNTAVPQLEILRRFRP